MRQKRRQRPRRQMGHVLADSLGTQRGRQAVNLVLQSGERRAEVGAQIRVGESLQVGQLRLVRQGLQEGTAPPIRKELKDRDADLYGGRRDGNGVFDRYGGGGQGGCGCGREGG